MVEGMLLRDGPLMPDRSRVVAIRDRRIARTSSMSRLLAVAICAATIGLHGAPGTGLAQNEAPVPAPEAGKPATHPGPYGLQLTGKEKAAWATSLVEYLDIFLANQLSASDRSIRERSRGEHDQAVESAVEQLKKWQAEGKLSEDDDRALQDLVGTVKNRQDGIVRGLGDKVYRFQNIDYYGGGPPATGYDENFATLSKLEGKERQDMIAAFVADAEDEIATTEKFKGELLQRVAGSKSHKSVLAKENWIRLISFIFTENVKELRRMIDDLNKARGFPVAPE